MSDDFYKSETFRSSVDDTWTTPKDFYAKLDKEFNFTLDAAALKNSTLVQNNWFGPDHDEIERRDAFCKDWSKYCNGGTVWLNPPYGRGINDWVAKADNESKKGITIVCLVPARTDTNWWWDSCVHHEIRFIKGRLKFGDGKNSAPFPSAVVIMKGMASEI
jgi:site-specific DNA-methyltransferase (adenine-specific)